MEARWSLRRDPVRRAARRVPDRRSGRRAVGEELRRRSRRGSPHLPSREGWERGTGTDLSRTRLSARRRAFLARSCAARRPVRLCSIQKLIFECNVRVKSRGRNNAAGAPTTIEAPAVIWRPPFLVEPLVRKIDTRDFQRATRTTSREINRRIVLNLVRDHQPVSRADLAAFMIESLTDDTWLRKSPVVAYS